MELVIVESPTKARTLGRFLGKEYQIEASMGHLRDLPKSQFGIDVDHDFKPEYVIVKDKDAVVKGLKAAAAKADQVILAMDPDREGEAIAYHVRYLIKNAKLKSKKSKFQRVTFHEITQPAIEDALKHPHDLDLKLVHAQQARRVVDRLVGYTLSPVLWKKVRRGLSAGRVQSVAVRLIVEREQEINAFKPQEYWLILVNLKSQKGEAFTAELISINAKKIVVAGSQTLEVSQTAAAKETITLPTKASIESVITDLKASRYLVTNVDRQEKHRSPYPPFTTSTLQQAAANRFGWSGRQTMKLAQDLYEQGTITYHRTDSVNLSPLAVTAAAEFIKKEFGQNFLPEKPRSYKTKSKNAQEAHEAIRPTDVTAKEIHDSFTPRHQKLYQLIWQRFLSSQMADAVYDATTIDIEATPEKSTNKYGLRVTGSIQKFSGWKKVTGLDNQDTIAPSVDKGETCQFIDVKSEQKFTQPPPRYSDASLVKALEERGIGRPSTYAPIISTIIDRGYIERTDRRFYPTLVGQAVVKFLLTNFDSIMDYDFTADMEENLDRIARGEKDWVPVVGTFWKPFKEKAEQVEKNSKRVPVPVEKTGQKCPECNQGEVVIRSGRFGKFLSCSRFPDCKYTANYQEKVDGLKCPGCGQGDVVIKRTKKGRQFYGCSRYPACKWASWTNPKQGNSE
ncbi:DNA topoisomerase I [Microgenomates group bacterium RIFCSPLOWO2_01_FULL_46_13]|nr:MAG: DNA topoisomerase I [Microgenomates group bacterium RIFCSPHIGHO2_01_FULL_45_11]OGV94878.1 MAG: DNA topoisomerase I [Microgenomates group bacterium RIFCSPLOWO2_01_FULL_46_13]